MSFNGSLVQNVGTGLFADLLGAGLVPPVDVIVADLNPPPGVGTRNQNWRLIPVDVGANLWTIRSVLTGQSAAAAVVAPGADIQSTADAPGVPVAARIWEITVIDNNTLNYIIRAPGTDLVWAVPAAAPPGAIINLEALVAGNPNQQWTFTAI